METEKQFWDYENCTWYSKSPFVHYKIEDEEFTMHYNNTRILTVPDGEVELFNICYYDPTEDPDAEPLLFFDPPFMDFLHGRGFESHQVSDPELIEYIREKAHDVEAKRFADEFISNWVRNG